MPAASFFWAPSRTLHRMIGTKAKLLLAVIIVGGAAFLVLRRSSPPTAPRPLPAEVGHGAAIDRSMAAVLAMQDAPEGNTPCESAYNAFKASYDVSQNTGAKAVVLRLAPRDEFLAKCAALPPAYQQCVAPKYLSRHREECEHVRVSAATALSGMVTLRERTPPGGSSEGNEPPPLPPLPSASALAP